MFAKTCHLHWIAGRANIYKNIYFSMLGVAFTVPFLCYFQKLQLLVVKNVWTNFLLHSNSIFMSSKSVSQIFKTLLQIGDINIFVLRNVFFSRYVQLKSYFSDEKKTVVKSETLFSREATLFFYKHKAYKHT